MKSAYRGIAFAIAALVVLQAAMITWAVSGLFVWIDQDGGVFDKAANESDTLDYTGVLGFMIHGMNGMMLIPLLALILLVISFFAKIPGGVKWAALILVAVIVQVVLGIAGFSNSYAGLLHGLNAMILLGLAVMAGKRVSKATAGIEPVERELV